MEKKAVGAGQKHGVRGKSSRRWPIRWKAVGPIQKRIGAGLQSGRGSRAKERWNQEDAMNNVRVKNPEKKATLCPESPDGCTIYYARDTERDRPFLP